MGDLNDENLISLADRPQRERKEIATMGAIASNKVQKQKKMMRETVQEVMKMKMTPAMFRILKERFPFLEEDMTFQTAMVVGQAVSGIGGNSKAFELLTELNDTESGNKSDDYEQELSVDELRGLLNESEQIKPTDNPKT